MLIELQDSCLNKNISNHNNIFNLVFVEKKLKQNNY